MVPIAPAVLNNAEALSFINVHPVIPSYSSTASIISANKGTNTVAVVNPKSDKPINVIGIFPFGKPKIFEGPKNISPIVATKKESWVMYLVGIFFARKATKGEEIANIRARKAKK